MRLLKITDEIELSIDEYKDKMREFVVRRLQAFLDLMNDEKKYVDGYNTTYQNYKAYKMADIKRQKIKCYSILFFVLKTIDLL
jgi:hypothetical protein